MFTYTPFTLQVVSPAVAAFDKTSLDHYLMSVRKFTSQWKTVPYLVHPTEVLKCLKFLPLNLVPWACTKDSEHVQVNFLLW